MGGGEVTRDLWFLLFDLRTGLLDRLLELELELDLRLDLSALSLPSLLLSRLPDLLLGEGVLPFLELEECPFGVEDRFLLGVLERLRDLLGGGEGEPELSLLLLLELRLRRDDLFDGVGDLRLLRSLLLDRDLR